MRRLILLLSLLALAQPATSWGPQAQEAFCMDVVSDVWGERGLACLDERTSYCLDLKGILGDSVGQQCLDAYAAGVEVYPYNAPEVLFNDVENHYNYDSCPLTWIRESNEWICSGKGNPAGDNAQMWFNVSRESTDYCRQVRSFCTGSYYYTSSYYPLLRVKYLQGCIGGSLDDMVDVKILSGESDWKVTDQCVFSYLKKMAGVSRETTQHVTFILTEADLDAVSGNLTIEAGYVRNPKLMPERTTTTTTSTTATTSTTTTVSETTTTTTTETTTSSSSQTTTTIKPTTTSTTIPPTTTIPKPEVNQSLAEIDSMLSNAVSSIEQDKKVEPTQSNNMMILAMLGVFLLISVILLVYIYSQMTRPHVHSPRRVILPPSMRRRMRKST
ncbi:MAG: hypothetical protein V1744_03055 [Candidatus Altiarchaeota archaeon]